LDDITKMAKYKKKVKNNQNHIKVKMARNEKINEGELDFFSRQSINGLYKAKKMRGNKIEFYGPEGICLAERLRKPISKHDFFFLLELIVKFTCDISESTLSINKIVFDLNQVYINEKTNELWFLYLPLNANDGRGSVNILAFIESMIYASNPISEQDISYMSRLIFFLRNLSLYDAKKIEQYIQNEDRTVVNQIRQGYQRMGDADAQTKVEDYQDYYRQQSNPAISNSNGVQHKEMQNIPNNNPTMGNIYQQNLDMNRNLQINSRANNSNEQSYDLKSEATGLLEDEDTGLLEDEKTGLLEDDNTGLLVENQQQMNYPKLHRLLTDEVIVINKPVFRIGKEKSYTDYFVSNNNAVSRNHADIVCRGNKYYVIDLNSKNRTFINDKVIPIRQETEIRNGDRLKLANEEFVFYAS